MTLEKELSDIEKQIRESVTSGDEFEYHKLLRMKQETTDKIFFAETKKLKSELENLESERAFGLSVRSDLQDELKAAAEVVLQCRSDVYDAEQAHHAVQLKQYFLDSKIEQQRKDIVRLKGELQRHINTKLQPGEKQND